MPKVVGPPSETEMNPGNEAEPLRRIPLPQFIAYGPDVAEVYERPKPFLVAVFHPDVGIREAF
jgi:hypothetical protein